MTLEAAIATVVREAVRAELRAALADLAPAPPAALPRYLSTQQAAEVAGVAPETIREWQDEGRLPLHKAGRHRRVRLDELEAFMRGPSTPPELSDSDLDARAATIVALRR